MRLITDVIRDIRSGRAVDDASEALAQLVRACLDTDKPGTLTLTLTVKPEGKDSGTVQVGCTIKTKEPRVGIPTATFFASVDGDLTRENPDQAPLLAGILRDDARAQGRA